MFSVFSYESITVSDIHTKVGNIIINAYESAGNYVGDFNLGSDNWSVEFMYADRNHTVKGIFKSGLEADCSYNTGLNIIYHVYGGNTKMTTQKPLNEDFKWHLETYSIDG